MNKPGVFQQRCRTGSVGSWSLSGSAGSDHLDLILRSSDASAVNKNTLHCKDFAIFHSIGSCPFIIVSGRQRCGLTWLSELHQLPHSRAALLRSALSEGYTNILGSCASLGQPSCKLLTVPCERQSCPRSFVSSVSLGRDGQSEALGIHEV